MGSESQLRFATVPFFASVFAGIAVSIAFPIALLFTEPTIVVILAAVFSDKFRIVDDDNLDRAIAEEE